MKINLQSLFESTNLVDKGTIQSTMDCVCSALEEEAEPRVIISKLLALPFVHPLSVELILSGGQEPLISDLLASFPTTVGHYATASSNEPALGIKLLDRLSKFFLGIDYDKLDASQIYRSYERAHKLLLAFAIVHPDRFYQGDDDNEDPDGHSESSSPLSHNYYYNERHDTTDNDESHLSKAQLSLAYALESKLSQTSKMSGNHRQPSSFGGPRGATPTIVFKLFHDLNLPIPSNKAEELEQVKRLLRIQKQVLKTFLAHLRHPQVQELIRSSMIYEPPQDKPSVPKSTTMRNTSGQPSATPGQGSDGVKFDDRKPRGGMKTLRAEIDFDGIEAFGEWEIYISTVAMKQLAEAQKADRELYKIYMRKIQELSKGYFSDDNQKRLTHVNSGSGTNPVVPLFEAKMKRDSRLVYQVHCNSIDSNTDRQAIRIFAILTHAQLERFPISSLSIQLGKFGKEYRQRCTFRNAPLVPRDKVYTPASFPPIEDQGYGVNEEEIQGPKLPKEDLDQVHNLLVTEKFVRISKSLLRGFIANLDATYLFNLTAQEREIVDHTYSSYVIGRSGTGKTTTMLFKIFGIQRAYELHADEHLRPRQMFVTKSRVLARKVEEVYTNLNRVLLTEGKSKEELLSMAKAKQGREQQRQAMIADEDCAFRSDLPLKFSELGDEHFPLFISFDKLCEMLESDISALSSDDTRLRRFSGRFVDFNIFKRDYWRHFPQNLTKGLSPILVFNEIMGVIKGSEEACRHKDRFLDRETYENLSHRSQWTFSTIRGSVYDLFERYLKMKRGKGGFDAADRTHFILQFLEQGKLTHQNIDYLYVDEAQDNLLIDSLLLRFLCRNSNGLFWAGDTAQTISVGSSFRFSDLKAFLHRVEERSLSQSKTGVPRAPPRTFQLTTNYRSHAGIVSCAYSVIKLISRFWGNSIDVLAPEKGVVQGDKPVFLSGFDQSNAWHEQFLFAPSDGNEMELGARQCILVRNEDAQRTLREQVGKIGLIMTLYDCKGLEFDDVLLYNFFEDSPVELAQWRVVLNVLSETDPFVSAPRFNEILHAGVCNELKFLYVAITRARNNAWIMDRSDKGEPMRRVWTTLNQIQNCTPETDVPKLAVTSSPDEWREQGHNLFQNSRWLQAMHCYEKAGLPREVMVCKAYDLRSSARQLPISNSSSSIGKRRAAYRSVARAFSQCAIQKDNTPDECFAYYRAGGEAMNEAEDFLQAAIMFSKAREFDQAAQLYRKVGNFDEAVNVIKQHRNNMDPKVVKNITDVAKLFYARSSDITLIKKALDLFNNIDEALEYFEDAELDSQRAILLEHLGRYIEAADVHASNGDISRALKLYRFFPDVPEAVAKAEQCILQGLRQHFVLATDKETLAESGAVKHFLKLSKENGMSSLDEEERNEILVFRAIFEGERSTLKTLVNKLNASHASNHMTLLLLVLDQYFNPFPNLNGTSIEEISSILSLFSRYATLLRKFSLTSKPGLDARVRHLCRIQTSEDETSYFLPSGSLLEKNLINSDILLSHEDSGVRLESPALETLFRRVITSHLASRIDDEEEVCLRTRDFNSPCLRFIAFNGDCSNGLGCSWPHIVSTALTPKVYTSRVRLYLQQIIIVHTHRKERRSQRFLSICRTLLHALDKSARIWMERLYDCLFPEYHTMGGISWLESDLLPEGKQAFQVLKYWFQDLLQASSPQDHTPSLRDVMHVAIMAFIFDQKQAPFYVGTSNAVQKFKHLPEYTIPSRVSNVANLLCHTLEAAPRDLKSISEGILFVRHIISKELTVDVSALCTITEYLAGQLVLGRRGTSGVTLPKSWLFSSLKHCPHVCEKQCRYYDYESLIASLGKLLNDLRSGKGVYLWYQNTTLDKHASKAIPIVFCARIVRTLGLREIPQFAFRFVSLTKERVLVGENLPASDFFQDKVRNDIVHALKEEDPPMLYKSFIGSKWQDISAAVRWSTTGSQWDEMIELQHRRRNDINPPLSPVRQVKFSALSDVPALLMGNEILTRAGMTSTPWISKLRATAKSFVPTGFTVASNRNTAKKLDPKADLNVAESKVAVGTSSEPEVKEAVENLYAAEADEAGMSQSEKVLIAHNTNSAPSEELIRAVHVIEKFRQRKAKLATCNDKPDAARLNEHFQACLAALDTNKPLRFKLLFLGTIPHVLSMLQYLDEYGGKRKKVTNKRLLDSKVEGNELEECSKQLTSIIAVIKGVKALQKQFDLKSNFYDNHIDFVLRLKKELLPLEDLILHKWQLSQQVKDAIVDHLEISVWSVDRNRTWMRVDQRERAAAKFRPALNVEDIEC